MKAYILLILVLCSADAIACGSVSQNMQRYWSLDSTLAKEEFLTKHSCYQEMNYSPLRADPIIVKIVSDAIVSGVKNEIVKKTISSFNCMYAAYSSKEYEVIHDFVLKNDMGSVCNEARLNSSYVIKAEGGVNLRSAPSTLGEKVGTVADGVLVMVLRVESGWAYVESYAGKGYIYLRLLKALNNA